MKKLLFAAIAVLTLTIAGAQPVKLVGFVFPEFTQGVVYYKNGTTSPGALNYDALSQRMSYVQNGNAMYLSDPQDIDRIVIAGRTFIPQRGNVFYEEVTAGKGKFYVNHRVEEVNASVNTGFIGVGSGGTMVAETSQYALDAKSSQMSPYRLQINEAQIQERKQYFLYDNGSYKSFSNASQISNVYGNKKEIADFAKNNKIDFKSIDDLKKIIEYAASLQ